MKRFSEQLHKQAKTVKLQAAEKRELRERLVSYMEYHPLPSEMKSIKPSEKKVTAPVLTDSFATFSIPFAKIFKSSAVAAAIVLVVLPFAAEKAVPGDTLYAIKVQFNEELRSTLTFDSYQKVEWETERLNRRIAEARLLASEGRLTEEVEAEVAAAVKTHTDNAKREIEELRTQDADEAAIASIALDTTLQVQSTSLRGDQPVAMLDGQTDSEVQANNLIANVIDQSISQNEIEGADDALPAYGKLMARVEMNTTRIYEYLDTISAIAPADEMADVTRRIEDIERSIQEAMELSGIEGEAARLQLIDVLQRSQRLIVYMTEIEVTQTVDIETLVPVVLTDVEEEAVVVERTESLVLKTAQIEDLYLGLEDVDVIEKVDLALVSIAELSAKMASSTDDLDIFQSTSDEAHSLADDTIVLLEKHLNPIEEIIVDIEIDPATTTDTGVEIEVENATSTDEGEVEGELNGTSTDMVNLPDETSTSSTSTVDSI